MQTASLPTIATASGASTLLSAPSALCFPLLPGPRRSCLSWLSRFRNVRVLAGAVLQRKERRRVPAGHKYHKAPVHAAPIRMKREETTMPSLSQPTLSYPRRIPFLALARYPVAVPLAAIMIGALAPDAAAAAHAALPVVVPLLVFLAVLATEMTPPTQREAGTALLILVATAVPGFLVVQAASAWLGLPVDLALPAAVMAASPVAIMSGVVSHSFGLPARPAVWAALLGLASGPLVLPTAAALGGGAGLLDPATLAYRAALCGALPALAALAVRRAVPGLVVPALPALGGLVVLALLPLGLAAGGGLRAAAMAGAGGGAAVVAVAVGTLAACTGTASLVGLLAAGRRGGLTLAVAGSVQNVSFAWAACVGALPPRADFVFATALAASFAMLGALRLVLAVTGRYASHRPRAVAVAPAVDSNPW